MPGVSLGYIIRCEATDLASTTVTVYSVYCCIMIFELRIKENRWSLVTFLKLCNSNMSVLVYNVVTCLYRWKELYAAGQIQLHVIYANINILHIHLDIMLQLFGAGLFMHRTIQMFRIHIVCGLRFLEYKCKFKLFFLNFFSVKYLVTTST